MLHYHQFYSEEALTKVASLHLNLKNLLFLMEQLQKTERTDAKERKDLIDASPIFPGWRQEGGGTGG